MSDIAKKIFEQKRGELMEGNSSIEELYEAYGGEPVSGKLHAYLLILNPDNPQYDDKLTCLEADHQMTSAGFTNVHAGFIESEGEAARIGIFNSDFAEEKLIQILGDVLFDVYKIQ